MARILIAEDEPRLAAFLEKGLAADGHVTTIVGDGERTLALARSAQFDLLLLDLGLPRMDGDAVLRALRADGLRLPVLVLSARDQLTDRVGALEDGADDYLVKPFAFPELLARVRVRLRQRGATEELVLEGGGVRLDVRARRATAGGDDVALSPREFVLLETFMRRAGEVLTREQLLSHVWGFDFDPGSNVVDVYVGHLRRKLGPARIATVRGAGYRFDPDA